MEATAIYSQKEKNFWSGSKKYLFALAVIVILAGVGAGIFLVQRNNQISDSKAADCSDIQNPSVTGAIIIPAGCSVNGTLYGGAASPGTTNDGGCVGYSQNGRPVSYTGPTTIDLNPACGQCEQVDLEGGFGTAAYGGECTNIRVCGEACTKDTDCKNPSAAGFPTRCNKTTGLCESAVCEAGKTIAGANCSCSTLGQCGDPCGPTAGNKVCDSTNSECGFITAFNQCREDSAGGRTTQYCLPKRPQNGYTKRTCSSIAASSLVKPDGTQTGLTREDVLTACRTLATATATATPTATSTSLSARCLNIEFYDTSWNKLTLAEIAQYKAGDTIRMVVAGSASDNALAKAKFRVNSVDTPETTLKRPGSNDFYQEYTFPSGINSFKVEAQLFHPSLGWF